MYIIGIKRLPDTDEWKVTHIEDGIPNESRAYYASDKEEAAIQAGREYEWAQGRGFNPTFTKTALNLIRRYNVPF